MARDLVEGSVVVPNLVHQLTGTFAVIGNCVQRQIIEFDCVWRERLQHVRWLNTVFDWVFKNTVCIELMSIVTCQELDKFLGVFNIWTVFDQRNAGNVDVRALTTLIRVNHFDRRRPIFLFGLRFVGEHEAHVIGG